MIAKGKSIAHGSNAIDYALDKDRAEIIDKRFVIGENGKEIQNEFKIFQNLNTRATNNNISFVLSPEPNDGRKLSNEDFKAISEDFLKKMKLDNHQAIIAKHSDKDHTHLHLIVNRIDSNGKAYKDSWISKESQTMADKVAQERGLTRASVVKEFNLEMTKDMRQQIFDRHKTVLQHRPRDFQQYKDLMNSSGVKIVPTINKADRLQGFRIEFQGNSFKASEVNKNMSLSKMGANISQKKAIGTVANLNPTLKISAEVLKNIGVKIVDQGRGISR